MRQVTVTEKYRAVLEGNMAKGEFVRQMRLAHPQHITQFNGFDDSVQILKNRGLLFEEKKKAVVIEEVKPESAALPYNDEAFQRGIRHELNAKGIEVHAGANIKLEDYEAAKDLSHKNLAKDPMHYLNLISGESSKVDKHDREVPIKRGEGKVDVFNGMKKANLKENKAELAKLLKEGRLQDLADRLGVPVEKLMGAADKIKDMERQSAERDALKLSKMKEVIDEVEDDELSPEELANKHAGTPFFREGEEGQMVDEHEYQFFSLVFEGKYDDILEEYMTSDQFKADERELQDSKNVSNTFDVKYISEWEDYIKQFEANNYDSLTEKKGKDLDGDGDVDGDDYKHAKDKAIKKAMGKDDKKDEQLKEAIKKIIKESLLTEAATARLSDIADKYGDYKGMQVVVNDLENIVTDMEGYFAKVRDRVQGSMDKIGQIETPDGMKVGAFLAPAIEAAFFRDLNPVRKLSAKDIKLPQVATISSADIAAARAGGDIEEQPKQTIFGINEKGEFKLRKDLNENSDAKELGKELFDFLKSQGLEAKMFRGEEPFVNGLYDKIGKSKNLAGISLVDGINILVVIPGDRKNIFTSQLPSIMKPQTDWNAAQPGEYVFKHEGSKGEAEIAMFNKK